MKFYTFLASIFFFIGLLPVAMANQDSTMHKADSLSYESQRQRVNKLLDDRSRRFGEYSASLEKKTGIFGLFKTKKDMQKSIDILRALVLNDNNIFIETRKLLELKDSQSIRYQQLASEYDSQVTAYMRTITKLQNENESLRAQLNQQEDGGKSSGIMLYVAIFVIIVLLFLLLSAYKKQKGQKVTE